jgi:uncharacterized protein (TIGR00255 family)
MTGYGKGVASENNLELSVEIKSVNNRYQDISIKMPKQFMIFENRVRELCKSMLIRGKVTVLIDLKETSETSGDGAVDEKKFQKIYSTMQQLKEEFNLNDTIQLQHFTAFPELFETDFSIVNEELFLKLLENSMQKALNELNLMRSKEGDFLKLDMQTRIKTIKSLNEKVFAKSKPNIQNEFNRLKRQVIDLIGEQKLDADRLEQEIAIIADKVDITEECIRLRSHLKLFEESMDRDEEVGKKLNFVLLEMLREANTINSKSTNAESLHNIIIMKEEIEKLREQIQNIE